MPDLDDRSNRPVKHGWIPTRKWFALLLTGLLTIGGNYWISGEWGAAEKGQLLTLAITLVTTYVTPNHTTAGGVPDATMR